MARTQLFLTQAERVFQAFGGVKELHKILLQVGKRRDVVSLYKWSYPKTKRGTGGLVPTHAWNDLLLAADQVGVKFDEYLFDPRPRLPRELE